jgi:D-3-phosphoglycerate dehydrogenase
MRRFKRFSRAKSRNTGDGAMYSVIITDCDLGPCDIERQVLEGIAHVVVGECRTEDDVIALARDADGVIEQYAPITRRVFQSLKRCKVVARYGVGVDTIDVAAASERGIPVVNVTHYCDEEVSDHTLAHILNCVRKITVLDRSVRRGVWNVRSVAPIFRLSGLRLGLLGFGSIARQVLRKALVFGVEACACDPYVDGAIIREHGALPVGFDELLSTSDIVSLHLPLTDRTHHIIDEKALRVMKQSAVLINSSRGSLVDQRALYRALSERWISAAGVDVVEVEPLDAESDLLKLDNIIITPHAAFYSEISNSELKRRAAEGVGRVLRGENPSSLVNPEVLQNRRWMRH